MPRVVIARPVKGVEHRVSKNDRLARAFAPFAAVGGDANQASRAAVAANLHDVVGLHAFAQPPQAAANQEVDDALLLPFI